MAGTLQCPGQGADLERRFLREASHELRTPITIIQGVSDLLVEATDDDDTVTRQRLERLRRSLRRMNTSVLSLLAMARAEHRLTVTELPPFEHQLEDMVEEARSLAQPGVEVSWQLVAAPGVGPAASMLIVALSNLARNAVQHTVVGSVLIRVDEERAAVFDTGVGAPESLLDQLRSAGPQPDVGIGLATVQRICRRFGWGFTLECPSSGGTEAAIVLQPATTRESRDSR
ncbi:MAG: HAMP domain-containing sensor histidine kinase [Acidobacteriota bacterium]